MFARVPRRLVAAIAALSLIASLGLLRAPQGAEAQRPAVRVYVLEGGHRASDQAVAQALRDRGFVVTRGVATPDFDGTQANLADYDVLVVLYTANWSTPAIPAGLAAIRAYVEGGGSLVTGEWFGWRGQLAEIMPSVNCSWNTAPSTTYTQVAPNSVINAGLPLAFTFPMGDFTGSESCLQARPEATVLYGSSNGGGRGDQVGLAAWNVGQGRVAAFSTLLSATELQSAEYRTLFQNTVAWAADVKDVTPPTVGSVELASAGGFVSGQALDLTVTASDKGGSGVGSVLVAEYVFSGNESDAWRLASTSGWRRYKQPGATVSLTLSATPGVHYLRVFAADRAGNISRAPGVVFVNYSPSGATAIGLDEVHVYRVAPGAVAQATVRMLVAAGNPDLSVVGPGLSFAPVSDAPVEETSFVPQAGLYEIGVYGYVAGSYSLEYAAGALAPKAQDEDATIERRGRGSVINLFPPEPVGAPGELPAPPAELGELALEPRVYLPAVQRP